jgi:hypothetical protein
MLYDKKFVKIVFAAACNLKERKLAEKAAQRIVAEPKFDELLRQNAQGFLDGFAINE